MRFQNQTAPAPAGLLNGGSQAGNDDPPPLVLVDLLVKEVAALVSDPTFAVETDTIATRLTIPLPAAVMYYRTAVAVMRRCAELVGECQRRGAAALLAGYLLAVVRRSRPLTPCRTVLILREVGERVGEPASYWTATNGCCKASEISRTTFMS